jgi:hypothetical protein
VPKIANIAGHRDTRAIVALTCVEDETNVNPFVSGD